MAAVPAVTVGSRTVTIAEHGDPGGKALFLFHGTPTSRLGHDFTDRPARERGIRVICPDRGGIGGSDPVPGRTIRGYAREVLDLADAMGIDQFAVLGYSGGGPYALACAAGCGPRLRSVGLMAGVGPVDDREGARSGMVPSDLHLVDLAIRHPRRAALVLRAQRTVARLSPATAMRKYAAELSRPDRDELARRDPRVFLAFFVESMRQGPAGVIEDHRLWAAPWELDWAAVTAPVHVFQGDADLGVPVHHAEDIISRLPAGTGHLHLLPGVGHVTIQTRAAEILDAIYPTDPIA